jgi:hypothetical protein
MQQNVHSLAAIDDMVDSEKYLFFLDPLRKINNGRWMLMQLLIS